MGDSVFLTGHSFKTTPPLGVAKLSKALQTLLPGKGKPPAKAVLKLALEVQDVHPQSFTCDSEAATMLSQ